MNMQGPACGRNVSAPRYRALMDGDTILPDVPRPLRRWEVVFRAPLGERDAPVPSGVPVPDAVIAAFTAREAVVSATVGARNLDRAVTVAYRAAWDLLAASGADLGRMTAEARPA